MPRARPQPSSATWARIAASRETDVFAINDAGIAVGYADDYDGSGTNLGERAVYWGLDGLAVDLNTLINPVSGWTLNRATAISNTGWIGGSGAFDPDGAGGQAAYARLFLMQVPAPSDLPGDFNHNGTVDAADYVVWRNGLGTTYTQDHYNVWRSRILDNRPAAVWRYPSPTGRRALCPSRRRSSCSASGRSALAWRCAALDTTL